MKKNFILTVLLLTVTQVAVTADGDWADAIHQWENGTSLTDEERRQFGGTRGGGLGEEAVFDNHGPDLGVAPAVPMVEVETVPQFNDPNGMVDVDEFVERTELIDGVPTIIHKWYPISKRINQLTDAEKDSQRVRMTVPRADLESHGEYYHVTSAIDGYMRDTTASTIGTRYGAPLHPPMRYRIVSE